MISPTADSQGNVPIYSQTTEAQETKSSRSIQEENKIKIVQTTALIWI